MILSTIFLAVVQAITEFLPISSSGHLILVRELFEMGDLVSSLSFDIILHLGTLIALLSYFRKDIRDIILGLFKKDKDNKLFWNLAVATIPVITIGTLLSSFIESTFRNSYVVVFNLITIGLLFILVENMSKKEKNIKALSLKQSFLIGIAQAFALVPGVSRSGITITAGLFLGLGREDSARFAFLLAIPAISLASLKGAYDLFQSGEGLNSLDIYLTGLIVSAFIGFFVIKYLLKYLKNHGLGLFAYYRFLVALIVILIISF